LADLIYAGTVYEDTWRGGFNAGFNDPDNDHTPPAPLEIDQQTVYSEGVLAGRDYAQRGLQVPPSSPASEESAFATIADIGIKTAEVVHTAYEFTKTIAAGSAGVFTLFAEIAIWGPTRPPFFDEAADEAMVDAAAALQQSGSTTAVDLYMAACDQNTHGTNASDPLMRQGWWHGTVFNTFDQALAEAKTHEHTDNTRVVHFVSTTPGMVEIIELGN
jgi:hypothetical protein